MGASLTSSLKWSSKNDKVTQIADGIVHVKFHYKEPETKPVDQSEIEMMARVLDQASHLEPEMQEILVKFANYLNQLSGKTDE